ncbi:hypothetical protein [Pedobacter zeae]|uniref:Ribosome maturation factor RimP n=1 Tax=Pedobacter zeae TaxID=1737356 RepID=A0A7W6P5N3_9SPHI|nr:hypothetical protein [Pedobacter zeae]MBB4107064.1 ribosome maturation factor RimP [Pedobacter zeae]GGH05533.1 hypothetical protein GCM10007422_21650 [Pedobacter zeae]
MEHILLENDLSLSFEKLPHTVRLILSKNNEEWACRKEKLIKLLTFIDIDQAHVFKGRLQLIKSDDNISIQVKNKHICSVTAEKFKQALNNLK